MNIIMLSIDSKVFEKESAVRARMIEYGKLVDRLDIVVYTKPGYRTETIAPNVTLYATNTRFRPLYFLDALKICRNLVEKHTLVTSQEAMTNIVAVVLKECFGARLEVQVHTDFMSPYFWKESLKNTLRYIGYRLGIAHADCVRVVSHRIGRSLNLASYTLNPIFVDLEKIRNTTPSLNLHEKYPQFEKIIVMASRLTQEKNISLGLSAMVEVVKKYPKTGLVIIGDGTEREALTQEVRDKKLENNVVFVGWQNDVISYYKTADIFLLTSYYEGYGMSLIEAASSGCPMVTTDVGLVGDILKDGESALVCPVGDSACIAEKITQFIENTKLAETLRTNAQKALDEHILQTRQEYLARYKQSWEACKK